MAYIVKYIGGCAYKDVDVTSLYQEDLRLGFKVVLVCEKEFENEFNYLHLDKCHVVSQIKGLNKDVTLLVSKENAKVDSIYAAAHLGSSECEFFTEYDGIYTANPSQYKFAKKIDRVDYDELLEISASGYGVLNNDVVEVAKRYSVAIKILSYNDPKGLGTIIKEVIGFSFSPIKGVVKDPNFCIMSVTDIPDEKGVSYKIFSAVADAGIVVDSIVLPAAFHDKQNISFIISKSDKTKARKILEGLKDIISYSQVNVDDNVAKISLIGSAVQSTAGVSATVFRIMYENDINLKMISTNEIKISIFIDKKNSDLAVQRIHEAFIR